MWVLRVELNSSMMNWEEKSAACLNGLRCQEHCGKDICYFFCTWQPDCREQINPVWMSHSHVCKYSSFLKIDLCLRYFPSIILRILYNLTKKYKSVGEKIMMKCSSVLTSLWQSKLQQGRTWNFSWNTNLKHWMVYWEFEWDHQQWV